MLSVFGTQNLPPFSTNAHNATLQESAPPSQTIPSFSTTTCDPPKIDPSLREYSPLPFQHYLRPFQNLPLPPGIYPLFNNYMRPSQKLPLPKQAALATAPGWRKWKSNEWSFGPPLCTYRLSWARRTSWRWWDEWDDTALRTQDSKFKPWRSEIVHVTSRSRRLPTIYCLG